MLSKLSYLVFLFVCLIFISSCSKKDDSNPVTPQSEKPYYPLAVGNTWIYTNSPQGTEQTVTINGSSVINGNTVCFFNGDDDYYFNYDKEDQGEGMFIKNNDVWGRKSGVDGLFLSNNPVVGSKYDVNAWSGAKMEILSTTETVLVPAGTFTCVKFKFGNEGSMSTYYMSKGVGIVKIVSATGSSTSELKSYTLK